MNEVVGRSASRRPRSSWPRDRRQRAALDAGEQARDRPVERCPTLTEQQERGLIALRESCFSSEDLREGIRAFAEKRKPKWQGR